MNNPAMYAVQYGGGDPASAALAQQQAYAAHAAQAALQQHLRAFWQGQAAEMDATTDFKNHNLPLARIKKIMKSDEDVRMISSEAPALFAKACEMFILEARGVDKRRTVSGNPRWRPRCGACDAWTHATASNAPSRAHAHTPCAFALAAAAV